jgi:hypothetical protein
VAALGVPLGCTINGAPCAGGTAPTTAPTPPATTPPATPATPPATGPVVDVSNADQLSAALAAARPGQTIRASNTVTGATSGLTNIAVTRNSVGRLPRQAGVRLTAT